MLDSESRLIAAANERKKNSGKERTLTAVSTDSCIYILPHKRQNGALCMYINKANDVIM